MKTYKGEEIQLHSFLTSALGGVGMKTTEEFMTELNTENYIIYDYTFNYNLLIAYWSLH